MEARRKVAPPVTSLSIGWVVTAQTSRAPPPVAAALRTGGNESIHSTLRAANAPAVRRNHASGQTEARSSLLLASGGTLLLLAPPPPQHGSTAPFTAAATTPMRRMPPTSAKRPRRPRTATASPTSPTMGKPKGCATHPRPRLDNSNRSHKIVTAPTPHERTARST